MLDSAPLPLQAILWPLLGAAIILVTWRFLPNWLLRVGAMAAALASVLTLHSLVTRATPLALQAAEGVEIFWEPVNLFRLSPILKPDDLSLLLGLTLAGTTAAAVLGIQGREPQRTVWHALILVALAGFLIMSMAANLLTLALGSAVLDLSLLAMAVYAPGGGERPMSSRDGHYSGRIAWRMAIPGILSTLVIVISALQMSAELGTASLGAKSIAETPLALLILAGMLRMLVYPLHPRGLRTPEGGFTSLVLANAGLFLVIRAQGAAHVLGESTWVLVMGLIALLAGGLLASMGALQTAIGQSTEINDEAAEPRLRPARGRAPVWPGVAIHQVGNALAFLLLVSASEPWPLISMTIAASMLAIWWDSTTWRSSDAGASRLQAWQAGAKAYIRLRLPASASDQGSRIVRYGFASLPAVALASLAGLPLTIGALGRWPFYAALLANRQNTQLIAVFGADTLLAIALWLALGSILRRTVHKRPGAAALLALAVLALAIVIFGVAPSHLGLERAETADVSRLSLGTLYILPWLIGGWLARIGPRIGSRVGGGERRYCTRIYQVVALDWAYQAANWAGQQLMTAVHWLGRVGEGEGWWGWALVVLLLGVMLLIIR